MGKEFTVHINCNTLDWEHLNILTVISCVFAENHISSNSLNCKAVLFYSSIIIRTVLWQHQKHRKFFSLFHSLPKVAISIWYYH